MSQSVSILNSATPVLETNLQNLALLARGKVRDIYAIDDQHLLIVTTDRLSAFDVVMPTPIPNKGKILTQVALFWFDKLNAIIPNHLSQLSLDDLPLTAEEKQILTGRSMLVKRLKPLPIEAIVRGYLIGSGWKDYQLTGTVCGLALPAGLQLAEKLPQPIFTPSTKAEVGLHDINISFAQVEAKLGKDLAEQVRKVSIELYQQAAAYALERKIIIADTKFEFGLDRQGNLVLIDEILTPDSSRFWPAEHYQLGSNPPSFDKQFVRDYLDTLDWDKTDPGPYLPSAIVEKTAEKYQEVATLLTQSN
ncbi:phosphoribosylaminoimidazolesuccinocarboxamide synthase [Thiothrix eikelboomii]|uniref:phosphoribosylaminoimidazolesuccinocarboxamide synthase n=1 Tax=Thiothrix eikelboomii TaxID=92487 RepID=UPI003BAE9DC3